MRGFFVAPMGQGVSLVYAMNRHRVYAMVNIAEALLSLLLCVVVVKHWGMIGIAIGCAIPIVLKYFVM